MRTIHTQLIFSQALHAFRLLANWYRFFCHLQCNEKKAVITITVVGGCDNKDIASQSAS